MNMHVQFLTDENGKRTAVQMSLKQWNDLQKNLSKMEVFEDLKAAFEEMKEHKKGKLKTPSTKQLLSQL